MDGSPSPVTASAPPETANEQSSTAANDPPALPAFPGISLADSFRYAQAVTRRSGSSFRYSFYWLPGPQYRAMCTLYAFMRLTDDLADQVLPQQLPVSARAASAETALQQWKQQLGACLSAGRDAHPLHPALRHTVQSFGLEQEWLDDVITGVATDLTPRVIQTAGELATYCYQVAGTVGLCCQAIWRADLDATRDLAIACGEAFQLTNILRDLHEDAMQGRCYLPREERERFGWDPLDPTATAADRAFAELFGFQLTRAQNRYCQAAQLDWHLQGPGRKMFRTMFATYRRLLERIAADPAAAWNRRVRLSRREKLGLVLIAPHRTIRPFPGCNPER